jgi:hypothetical protein
MPTATHRTPTNRGHPISEHPNIGRQINQTVDRRPVAVNTSVGLSPETQHSAPRRNQSTDLLGRCVIMA